MNKFDSLLGDIMYKAKNAADIAGKKTGEVVEVGKLKYQVKQMESDIEKTYAKLGAILYESKKNTEDYEEIIALAISEIDALKEKQEDIEEKLRTVKQVIKCESCSKENEMNAHFCVRCGASLEEESFEAEPVQEEVTEEEPKAEESPDEE